MKVKTLSPTAICILWRMSRTLFPSNNHKICDTACFVGLRYNRHFCDTTDLGINEYRMITLTSQIRPYGCEANDTRKNRYRIMQSGTPFSELFTVNRFRYLDSKFTRPIPRYRPPKFATSSYIKMSNKYIYRADFEIWTIL